MEPTNHPLETKNNDLPIQTSMLMFHVNLQGCMFTHIKWSILMVHVGKHTWIVWEFFVFLRDLQGCTVAAWNQQTKNIRTPWCRSTERFCASAFEPGAPFGLKVLDEIDRQLR